LEFEREKEQFRINMEKMEINFKEEREMLVKTLEDTQSDLKDLKKEYE